MQPDSRASEPPPPRREPEGARLLLRGSTVTALVWTVVALYGLYRLIRHVWR